MTGLIGCHGWSIATIRTPCRKNLLILCVICCSSHCLLTALLPGSISNFTSLFPGTTTLLAPGLMLFRWYGQITCIFFPHFLLFIGSFLNFYQITLVMACLCALIGPHNHGFPPFWICSLHHPFLCPQTQLWTSCVACQGVAN